MWQPAAGGAFRNIAAITTTAPWTRPQLMKRGPVASALDQVGDRRTVSATLREAAAVSRPRGPRGPGTTSGRCRWPSVHGRRLRCLHGVREVELRQRLRVSRSGGRGCRPQ